MSVPAEACDLGDLGQASQIPHWGQREGRTGHPVYLLKVCVSTSGALRGRLIELFLIPCYRSDPDWQAFMLSGHGALVKMPGREHGVM